MGDVVNGAFAIAKPCHVLTIDNMDYPLPFFMEVTREEVRYVSKRGKEVTDIVHILRPDTDNTKRCFETHQV